MAPVLKIFHFPKPGVPTLWQEVGQEYTKRPKGKRTPSVPLGARPGITNLHTKIRSWSMWLSEETLQSGLLWQESDWTVTDSLGKKANGLEATMNKEGTNVDKFSSFV